MVIDNIFKATSVLWELIFWLKQGNLLTLDVIMVKNMVYEKFNRFDEKATFINSSITAIQDVKFAFSALLDEVILSSNWQWKDAWAKNSIQLELFGEHLAGEKFFIKLSELKKNLQENVYIIQVYYYCLLAGYQGVYRLYQQEKLKVIQLELFQDIAEVLDKKTSDIAVALIDNSTSLNNISVEMFSKRSLLLLGGVVICTYISTFIASYIYSNKVILSLSKFL